MVRKIAHAGAKLPESLALQDFFMCIFSQAKMFACKDIFATFSKEHGAQDCARGSEASRKSCIARLFHVYYTTIHVIFQ